MTAAPVEVVDIGDANLAAAKAFLQRNPETSLFLLSNIRAFGTRLGDSIYSGNLRGLLRNGEFCGIFSLTRGGSLLAQTHGDARLAAEILRLCRQESIEIRGTLGEWNVTSAIWDLLLKEGITPAFESKEVMYRLALGAPPPIGAVDGIVARMLTPDDYGSWDRLMLDFLKESRLPLQGTPDQRKAGFLRSSALGHWWGGFHQEHMVSMVGITALYETVAQIGGVFTEPARRRGGLSRLVMSKVMDDARAVHGLDRLFLFTGEHNVARHLYESLGFERFGHFGVFFGE